jgi:transposase
LIINQLMSNKLILMSKVRQILRLYTQGVGKKNISRKAGATRNTVKRYIHQYIAIGKTLDELEKLNDTDLEKLFMAKEPAVTDKKLQELYDYFPQVEKALKRKGATREGLWQEYLQKHPDGYRETQFRHYYNLWSKRTNASAHIDHKAGDKMYVDYAGEPLYLINDSSGEKIPMQVFVAILGASQLTYVEASYTQQKEDFIRSCENAIRYFGGAPQAIVTDNLKSAVIKSDKYEPTLNEAFSDFVLHYNMAALPAGPYKPRHKALVEGAVRISYTTIYEPLRERIFTVLEDLNTAIWIALEEHNNRLMKGRPYSRRQMFEEVEKAELQPLPLHRYEVKRKKSATVMKNNYVYLGEDKHYYSVPFIYIGKKVTILYGESDVEIFYRYERIAQHHRSRLSYRYTTIEDHLASKNRFMSEWTPELFLKRAREVGDDTYWYIVRILEKRLHPEQAYRSCQGILIYAKKVGKERLNNACRRGAYFNDYCYMTIKTILERRLDNDNSDLEDDKVRHLPLHDNIRGKTYYK